MPLLKPSAASCCCRWARWKAQPRPGCHNDAGALASRTVDGGSQLIAACSGPANLSEGGARRCGAGGTASYAPWEQRAVRGARGVQQFAEERTGATEARERGRATVWESPKQPEKAVSAEARIVLLGASAKLKHCAGESDLSGANRSTSGGAVAELETRRQKEAGWLEVSHFAAVACVCCVQAEMAAPPVVRRAGSDVCESTMQCTVNGKLGPR
ncbi:hypothetical protein BU25DRAFT_425946 [Macroventuria anomochaeta]|uniref:Uncharacterized protein n=1 Tax=Macroventuria anomochaeta TaxID=301207 RepID=A0ACB6RLH3_9PLEO|nr:uncharacterized protein BU25DRAFT_425946 [Macroventuria anomochaeta]KAF2622167.1 hypothetical protein BU25DRAFT_425946 [Macroventuria anomochaeta]